MTKSFSKTRILVECALMIALGTVLANIKIFELPNGGSITLFSMVPFILVSFRRLCQAVPEPAAGRGGWQRRGLLHPVFVQLPVRCADLGQPQRRPARLDLQPDL